jgi:hypothetical protein
MLTRRLKKGDSKRSMLTLLFSGYSLLVNGQYFCDDILEEVSRPRISITKKTGIKKSVITVDNSTVHNSRKVATKFEKLQFVRLLYPSYSPDISPCHFSCFEGSKDMM